MPTKPTTPMTLEELLQLAGQGQISQTPKLMSPQAQGYAPSGPQINFMGGSPHPVNETPAIMQNGMILLTQLRDAIAKARAGGAQGGGPPPGPATMPGGPQMPGF